jgi:alkanesulfonate monooxygenase SsuD/methylene tetrahydromethanopterin reductase-like flavin-dependent oxidoreductase (luciferase family)
VAAPGSATGGIIVWLVSSPLRFSIKTQQQFSSFAEILPCWLEAEQLGFDAAWLNDHFMPPMGPHPEGRCEDGWTLLPALLARTQRIRGGVMVTGNTYRHPALLAKMAATADCLSDGRLEFALGSGWFEPEHRMYGWTLPSIGERMRRLDESCHVLKALWTEPRPSFAGEFYELSDAYCEPTPVQKPYPHFVLGARGERVALKLAAQHADEWNWVVPLEASTPKEAGELYQLKVDALERHLVALGRDPGTLSRSIQIKPRESSAETAELAAEHVSRGVDHVLFVLDRPYTPERVARVWHEYVAPIRERAGR